MPPKPPLLGASRDEWAAYAVALGLNYMVGDEDNRDRIVSKLVGIGAPTSMDEWERRYG